MFRVSNTLISILNSLTMLISLAAIGTSVYLQVHGATDCQRVVQWALLWVGVFLFAVSLVGLIGACCRISFLLVIYVIIMFLLIIGLGCLTIFWIIVTNKGVGQEISGRGFKEYKLGDYSNWLQKYVVNAKNWDDIRSCLIEAQVCKSLGGDAPPVAADFYEKRLSPIQSGCCKPPTSCGFEFKNPTFWVMPETGPAAEDSDCKTWSNNQTILCYACNSCKGGVLENIKKEWRLVAIFNACIIGLIVIVYSLGCFALRNNRKDNRYSRHKNYA
ncbi:Tetraspanin/Peripherin [Dillenia turbinata]|uniref:Tetraspanin/Peripherin n=1 Tax=Dillenia turbinata TaxID=194707 RepID=A0AAN8V5F1_9MAGN